MTCQPDIIEAELRQSKMLLKKEGEVLAVNDVTRSIGDQVLWNLRSAPTQSAPHVR
jgi:hypothetical protein